MNQLLSRTAENRELHCSGYYAPSSGKMYHYRHSLRYSSEDRSSHMLRGGSLKSRKTRCSMQYEHLFQPYKSPGIDGIMSIMLQQCFELLAGKFLMLLRASLFPGCIPMSWRHIRVVFIHKPGKTLSQAKSLKPISLMSYILQTLEKLFDRRIRDGVLVERPLH